MKVRAKNDQIRAVLFHPTGAGIRFREDGTADWPDDSYTHRRIEDGDITAEEDHAAQQEQSAKKFTKAKEA